MTRTRYRIFQGEIPHFMTWTVVAWLPVFTRSETVEIVLDSWRYLQRERDWKLYGYVILENHLHLIASSANLAEDVGDSKSFTARKVIDCLEERGARTLLQLMEWFKLRHKKDQTYQLWQEGSHPQEVRDSEMMLQKLEYMHENPRKRGYVDEPTHWRYSSARNYEGMPGLIEVATDW